MNWIIQLHELYNTILVIPRPAQKVLSFIDAIQEMKGVKLSRCVIEAAPDPKTQEPRCVWGLTTYDPALMPLIEEVLGLSPNEYSKR